MKMTGTQRLQKNKEAELLLEQQLKQKGFHPPLKQWKMNRRRSIKPPRLRSKDHCCPQRRLKMIIQQPSTAQIFQPRMRIQLCKILYFTSPGANPRSRMNFSFGPQSKSKSELANAIARVKFKDSYVFFFQESKSFSVPFLLLQISACYSYISILHISIFFTNSFFFRYSDIN